MKTNTRFFPAPVVSVVCAWLVFVVCAFSDAASDLVPVLVLFYGGLLWGIIWLIRVIVAFVRQRRGSVPRQSLLIAFRYWGFEPAVFLFSAVLIYSDLLCLLRFQLSRPFLDSYVAEVVAGHSPPHGLGTQKHWVGLFRVAESELHPDGVVRIITAEDFLDDAGFTYSPASPPPRIGEDSYTHITGSWYHWHRSW